MIEEAKTFYSIIIPTLNSASTLNECLTSIFNQTFQDFEVIIIDGHSTDQTIDIANNFGSQVNIVEARTKGIYNAMNEGVDFANGEWLYFLGSDDKLYDENVLEKCYYGIEGISTQVFYGNAIGTASKKITKSPDKLSLIRTGFHHQCFFYNKTLFLDGMRFNPLFKVSADYYFTLIELLNKKRNFTYIDLMICEYGENGFSSTNVDYLFFSKHFALIKHTTKEFLDVDFGPELMTSINCCLYLAKEKQHVLSAWINFINYLFEVKLTRKTKLVLFSRMVKNTIRFW